jgi:membrane-associated phospholipid phosphatase
MSNTAAKGPIFRFWILTICIGLASSLAFLWVAETVRHGTQLAWDTAISRYLQQPTTHKANAMMTLIARSGDLGEVVVIAAITALVLIRRQKIGDVLFVAVALAGVVVLNLVVRTSVQRPLLLSHESFVPTFESGFPSSQAADTFTVAFVLTILCWPTQWRWIVAIVGVFYLLAVGLSRVHLGMQLPTDILGGWLLALTWILVVNFKRNRPAQMTEIKRH